MVARADGDMAAAQWVATQSTAVVTIVTVRVIRVTRIATADRATIATDTDIEVDCDCWPVPFPKTAAIVDGPADGGEASRHTIMLATSDWRITCSAG